MRLAETRDLFSRQLTFPVEHETVSRQIGDVELDAPSGSAETIGEIIARTDDARYDSADELFDALITNVGDQYVGRKFYDDRGTQHMMDNDEVSF
ncbi:MAG: hypothetical protein ABEJ28_01985 [Salinigranum sp.]